MRRALVHGPVSLVAFGVCFGSGVCLSRREQMGRHRAGFAIVGLLYADLWAGGNYLERVTPDDAGLQSETVSVMGQR